MFHGNYAFEFYFQQDESAYFHHLMSSRERTDEKSTVSSHIFLPIVRRLVQIRVGG